MNIKHKGLRALTALAGMAAAMFVTQLAVPTAAQAYCASDNNPRTLRLEIDGALWAQEVSTLNTCNDNGTYQGDFRSFVSGWQAVVLSQDDGQWTRFYGGFNMNWTHYQIYDENSHTLLIMCVTDGTNWKCGNNTASANSVGGPNYTFFEVNDEF